MKENDLLKAIGQIDEKYIDEAMKFQPKKKPGFVKWAILAICLCLVVKYWPIAPMNSSPSGKEEEMIFDYGPIYPLRSDVKNDDLLVERELHFDFVSNDFSANLSDQYTITNTSSKDLYFKGIYPFVDYLANQNDRCPTIQANAKIVNNILNTDIDVKEITELKQTVKVLKINNVEIKDHNTVCDLHIHFDYDPTKTKILSAYSYLPLIQEGVVDEDNLYDYFYQVDKGARNDNYFIFIGDDIKSYTIDAYENNIMNDDCQVVDVEVDSEIYSKPLNFVLEEIVERYIELEQTVYEHDLSKINLEQLKGLLLLSLQEDHILDIAHHRDDDYCGMYLYNNIERIMSEQRLLFTSFEIVVPASSSLTIDINSTKYGNQRAGQGGYYDYNFFTKEGSELNFTKQFVSAKCEKNEIVSNNCGLDLEKGIDRVELDLHQDTYYIQVRSLQK